MAIERKSRLYPCVYPAQQWARPAKAKFLKAAGTKRCSSLGRACTIEHDFAVRIPKAMELFESRKIGSDRIRDMTVA